MGEKNTGGYDISIVKISVDERDVEIYVEETTPSKEDIVTQAFTYPVAQIVFYGKVDSVSVKSITGEEEYQELKS